MLNNDSGRYFFVFVSANGSINRGRIWGTTKKNVKKYNIRVVGINI